MKTRETTYQSARVFETTLFHVTTNTDTNEGRGAERTLGWFVDKRVAADAAKGNYVMGTDCPVHEKKVTVVQLDDGRLFLLGDNILVKYEDPRKVRARALAKLSAEEREVLGIKG